MENQTAETPLPNHCEGRDTIIVRVLGALAMATALLFPISRFIVNAMPSTTTKLEPGTIVFMIVVALLGMGYGLLFVLRGLKISPKTIFILDTISLIAWILYIYIFLIAILLAGIFGSAFVAFFNQPLSSSSASSSVSSSASSSSSASNPILEIGNRFFDVMIIFTFIGIARLVFSGLCAFKKEPSKGLYMTLLVLTMLTLLSLLVAQIVTGLDLLGSLHPMIACEMACLAADYFVLKNRKVPDSIQQNV